MNEISQMVSWIRTLSLVLKNASLQTLVVKWTDEQNTAHVNATLTILTFNIS